MTDFISGRQVRETPEELEAVQPFSRMLVYDYRYPVELIQTRPQFRVKGTPSGSRSYPVDISVFSGTPHTEENAYIIVECKRKSRSDGRSQLEDYLRLCPAQLGVWVNYSGLKPRASSRLT